MTYATDTRVPIQRTKHEIQALLAKHGADRFYCAEEPERAQVGCFLGPTLVKITLPFVAGNRKPAQHDQLKRSRWRTGRASVRRSAATLVETDGRLGRSPGKFAFPSTPTHTRLARDGKGGSNAQGCASRGHFVRLVGLFRFGLLARLEPPPGASALKLER